MKRLITHLLFPLPEEEETRDAVLGAMIITIGLPTFTWFLFL